MTSQCSYDWKDEKMKALCLEGNSVTDTKMSLPVTNTKTKRTYVNSYCATCNIEDPNALEMWYLVVECSEMPDEFYEFGDDFQFNTVLNNGNWGIIPINSPISSYIRCNTRYKIPLEQYDSTRHCTPSISNCNESFTSTYSEKYSCQSHTAAVYIENNNIIFRNKDCAKCNGYDNYSCFGPPPSAPLIQLTMLLDFSGTSEANISVCSEDELWDQIHNKCRRIICPKQGEKFSYGRCVSG